MTMVFSMKVVSAGDRFGRLEIVRETERGGTQNKRRFVCQCDCGEVSVVYLYSLVSGNTTSCGCAHSEQLAKRNSTPENRSLVAASVTKHGDSNSVEYGTLSRMIQRCHNPENPNFKDYGGRGITVCDEWRHDFAAFLAHVGRRPSSLHTIDRYPDNDGNYEPGNVRWATREEQARNQRTNIVVQYGGKERLLIEVCEEIGFSYQVARVRHFRGMSDSELFKPVVKPFGGPSIEVGAAI